jgi:hypothetical protein
MTKPMTEKQKARWNGMRARGWAWFVFVRGILRYGIPWGAMMLLFSYFHPFGGQWYGFQRELPVLAVTAALFGIIVAWVEWRREERRFEETVNAGITPSV